ncbi:hypothetical protein [Actinoalloteichus caeruleus]|uniref:hypothetical protein n=1 Tax=Actinoalloteichus cyanogriseus TaxID=2893586 RepID=UPI003BB8E4C0
MAAWSVFAWALNPPMRASTIAAAPGSAMTAVSLNISGLYVGAAVGGLSAVSSSTGWVHPRSPSSGRSRWWAPG